MTDEIKAQAHSSIQKEWEQIPINPQGFSHLPLTVRNYLSGQNLEALYDRPNYLESVRLASDPDEDPPVLAFAIRDADGQVKAIRYSTLEGLLLLANAVCQKHHVVTGTGLESIAGCSVHFGEPEDDLGVAVSAESAMAMVIATGGTPCWACLGETGLRTIQVPERIRKLTIYADGDCAEAAHVLAERLGSKHQVDVKFPPCSQLGLAENAQWHDAWMCTGNRLLRL